MTPFNGQDGVLDWLQACRVATDLTVEPVPLDACAHWRWDGVSLRHEEGRFFSVVGMRATLNNVPQNTMVRPMIEQPEIGVLGFLVKRADDRVEWLLQAKTEPGNVHGVQVGPSVQATLSNYQRVHHGRPTPMIECFVGDRPAGAQCLSESLQSEQGDRFLGKFNRNVVMAVSWHHPVGDAPAWRWFSPSAVRQALVQDYVINTDARSVMVCSPWDLLADDTRGAFARWQGRGGLGEALYQSVQASGGVVSLRDLRGMVEGARRRFRFERQACSLSSLPGWHATAMGLYPPDDDPDASSVQTFSVRASEREVPRWSQPLMVGGRGATVAVLCTRWDEILHVLLRLAPEPGFKDHVQLGPSDIDAQRHHRLPWVQEVVRDPSVRCLVSARQSDEGGRFMQSLARYEVREVEASQVPRHDPDAVWLTLAQVQTLAQQSGLLTNEARSALSLLLGWA